MTQRESHQCNLKNIWFSIKPMETYHSTQFMFCNKVQFIASIGVKKAGLRMTGECKTLISQLQYNNITQLKWEKNRKDI